MRAPVPTSVDRAFNVLLRAYPGAFREQYAGEMRAAFRSRWRGEREGRAPAGTAGLWLSVLLDIVRTAPPVHFEILARDVRDAVRSLTGPQHRSFTAAALITLAVGIGAVTTIFTIVHAVLLAPLPYGEPDRVVRIQDTNAALGIPEFSLSLPNFLSLQERARSFSTVAALRGGSANLTGGSEPERVNAASVSHTFFAAAGLRPAAGRAFEPSEDYGEAAGVVMIGERLWARRYARSPAVIGQTLDVNLASRVIVGVAPQDAGFASDIDIWLPLGRDPEYADQRGDRRVIVLGRLAPGLGLTQANDELARLSADLAAEFPAANRDWQMRAVAVREWIVDDELGQRLRIVLAAVALLLLVAASNVANLQLARTTGRSREIAVRLALGASRPRIVRQLVTESLVLSAAGGMAGLALAFAGVRITSSLLPASIPRADSIAINLPVLLVAALCIVATTVLSGLLPAASAVRASVRHALQQAGRSSTSASGPARQLLVGLQIALATALVVTAALLGQSLAHLQRAPLGFMDPDHLLTARITRSVGTEASYPQDVVFFRSMLDEVRALPGVISAGLSSEVPFGDADTTMSAGVTPPADGAPVKGVQASWRIVTGDYLRTMNVPLVRGRLLDEWKDPRRSMMVSETLARRLWPDGSDPSGATVWLGNRQAYTVIGVVGDVRQIGLKDDPTPTVYLSPRWILLPTMTLVVRTSADPAALAQPIRAAVARVDSRQPVADFQTMRTAVEGNAAEPQLNSALLASFAALALLLASVGVAGVVSYAVGQRTPEIAVRLALGSTPAQAVRLVMRAGLGLCAAGIAVGIFLALALGRAMSGVLYGVHPNDPLTLAAAAVALLVVALVACWLPARRASRISPSMALRA